MSVIHKYELPVSVLSSIHVVNSFIVFCIVYRMEKQTRGRDKVIEILETFVTSGNLLYIQ